MIDVTQLLNAIADGEAGAANELLPLVYDELRSMARKQMAFENDSYLLDPTGLVHEAYLRLVKNQPEAGWNGRGHFFCAAALAMRRILVESARRKRGLKRGGGQQRHPLTGNETSHNAQLELWLSVDQTLNALAATDPIAAQVAQLRLFTGQSIDEAAHTLEISRSTAFRAWAYARAVLRLQLQDSEIDSKCD